MTLEQGKECLEKDLKSMDYTNNFGRARLAGELDQMLAKLKDIEDNLRSGFYSEEYKASCFIKVDNTLNYSHLIISFNSLLSMLSANSESESGLIAQLFDFKSSQIKRKNQVYTQSIFIFHNIS